jgi:hypothetical protein
VLRDDIDVDFKPEGLVSEAESRDWADTIASALPDVSGGLSLTFVAEGEQWVLRGITYGRGERNGFVVAYDDDIRGWRDAIVRALVASGRRVVAGPPRLPSDGEG